MKTLDKIDQSILELLQKDGRMTVKEISKRLNLTSTPIFERIKKMEKSGNQHDPETIWNKYGNYFL